MVRLWRRRRPALVMDPAPELDDEVTLRLRALAEQWQRDPGVPAWADDHTRLLPVITPAARERGWGRR